MVGISEDGRGCVVASDDDEAGAGVAIEDVIGGGLTGGGGMTGISGVSGISGITGGSGGSGGSGGDGGSGKPGRLGGVRARLEKGLSRLAGASNRDRSSLRRQDRHEGENGEGEEFSHDEEVFR